MSRRLLLGVVLLASGALAPAMTRGAQSCSQEGLDSQVDAFKTLAPRLGATPPWKEAKMAALLLSVNEACLSQFKFALEYDGDYKDLVEYIFHDVDNLDRQGRILEHFRKAPRQGGVKVLTDVDDTMFANLVDARYRHPTLYPGVVEFYNALKHEPFESARVPVTTLTARPNPVGGRLEEGSLENVVELTDGKLAPSALSGKLASSSVGTIETLWRANPILGRRLFQKVPHQAEDRIGEVKFANCQEFARVYPEYDYVFVGDSGQADALTAQLLMEGTLAEGAKRPLTTFIHDLRVGSNDSRSASAAFGRLPADVREGQPPPDGRGVIVFRNYIGAAVVAYQRRSTLADLITAEELATITTAALVQFERRVAHASASAQAALKQQYQADAEAAVRLLATAQPNLPAVAEIRGLLDRFFWQGTVPGQ